jgi:hypothetical protein
MNPKAQRIAIAEACGWRMGTETVEHIDGYQWTETRKFWTSPTSKIYSLPDYLNDLNAMHEATQSLTKDQLRWYRNLLIELTGTFEAIDATAPQRAEAFLRTIGKWENTAAKEGQL